MKKTMTSIEKYALFQHVCSYTVPLLVDAIHYECKYGSI